MVPDIEEPKYCLKNISNCSVNNGIKLKLKFVKIINISIRVQKSVIF